MRPFAAPASYVQAMFFWAIRRSPFVTDVKRALGA